MCLRCDCAAVGGRRIARAPYATFAVARGRGRASNGRDSRAAGRRVRRFGGDQVVARRVARDRERSRSCPGIGQRAARRVPKGWRARCRETRRGRRMRRRGNTRRRAVPHFGAGSGCPDGHRVAHLKLQAAFGLRREEAIKSERRTTARKNGGADRDQRRARRWEAAICPQRKPKSVAGDNHGGPGRFCASARVPFQVRWSRSCMIFKISP